MTKHEKLEKAQKDHAYAMQRIGELEKELSNLRFKLRSTRDELAYARGKPRPEPYDHHY